MFALLSFPALLAVPVWVVAVIVKLVSLVLPGRRPDWGVRLLRWGTGMMAAAAAVLLVLALGLVQFSDHESKSGADSAPAPSCRAAVPHHPVQRIEGHRVSYLPPAFDCVMDDGTTYPSSAAYKWLNGLTLACAAASALLAAGAKYATHRKTAPRTAPQPRVPDAGAGNGPKDRV